MIPAASKKKEPSLLRGGSFSLQAPLVLFQAKKSPEAFFSCRP